MEKIWQVEEERILQVVLHLLRSWLTSALPHCRVRRQVQKLQVELEEERRASEIILNTVIAAAQTNLSDSEQVAQTYVDQENLA
eukprot:136765-Hanusia_phi.AAC.1